MNTYPIQDYTYQDYSYLTGKYEEDLLIRKLSKEEFEIVKSKFKYVMIAPHAIHEGEEVRAKSVIYSSLDEVSGDIFLTAYKHEYGKFYMVRGVY